MSVREMPFGKTSDGKEVTAYTMTNASGASCTVIDYGAAILSIRVPDADGVLTDIALGYRNAADYEACDSRMGALVGRSANRIAGAAFSIDGTLFQLPKNDGDNNLHSWPAGMEHKHFRLLDISSEAGKDTVCLGVSSPDGDGGMPGKLDLTVSYTWTDRNRLDIAITAVTDAPTVCNPTSHFYCNLNGHGAGSVLDHSLQLFADAYIPVGEGSIPLGTMAPVEGTPFDFRTPRTIGRDILADNDQLRLVNGYDHSFCIRGQAGTLRPAAILTGDRTGIRMTLWQTAPGLQVYTSNFLGDPCGKDDHAYSPRCAVAMEPQFHPNAVNTPAFESPLLRPGTTFRSGISFAFEMS